jgi:hypothetical protein
MMFSWKMNLQIKGLQFYKTNFNASPKTCNLAFFREDFSAGEIKTLNQN